MKQNQVLKKEDEKQEVKLMPMLLSNQIQPVGVLKGHTNSVESISLNQTNKNYLVSGSHDLTLKIWDLNNKTAIQTLKGHKEGIWTCQYSPDGNIILSGSPDATVMLWDPKSGKAIKTIKEHSNKVYWAKFNENGNFFASGGQDSKILIYDMKADKVVKKIQTESQIIYAVEFSKDGQFICTSDIVGVVSLYDQKTFNLITQTKKYNDYLYDYNEDFQKKEIPIENRAFTLDLDLSAESKVKNNIYVGYQDGFIRKFQYKKENKQIVLEKEVQAHTDSVKNIVIDAKKSPLLISSSRDGGSRIWDLQNIDFKAYLVGHSDNVSSCAFSSLANGKMQILTGSWDQTINIYSY